ncbi:hypothetical protein RUND412_000220 [Rhizina undulata]
MIRLRPSTIILTREEIVKALDTPRVSATDSPYSMALPWNRNITFRKHNYKGKQKAAEFFGDDEDEEDDGGDSSFRFSASSVVGQQAVMEGSLNSNVVNTLNADDEGYFAGTDDDHLEEEGSTNAGSIIIDQGFEGGHLDFMSDIHNNDALTSPTPGLGTGDNILGPSTGNIPGPMLLHDGALSDEQLPFRHIVASPDSQHRRDGGDPIDIDYLADIDFDGPSDSDQEQENTFISSLTLPDQLDGSSEDSYDLPINRPPFSPPSNNSPDNSFRYIRASPFSLPPHTASPQDRRLFSSDFLSSDGDRHEFCPPFTDHRHQLRHRSAEQQAVSEGGHFLRMRRPRDGEAEIRRRGSNAPARSLR